VVNATNHNLAGLPFPDRPQSSRTLTGPARSQRDDQIVIVRPGDTLWAIARRSLRPGASEAEVAAASVEWFAANRAVIGNDPDLIFPAQRLHPPTKEHS
jgi:nucleoid-associated protein YgaU